MSLKIVTPITIDDSNMVNTIPIPDASQGEVEWEDKLGFDRHSVTSSFIRHAVTDTASGIAYVGHTDLLVYDLDNDTSTKHADFFINEGGAISSMIDGGNGFIYFSITGNLIKKFNKSTLAVTSLGSGSCNSMVITSSGIIYGFQGIISGSPDVEALTIDTSNDTITELTDFYFGISASIMTDGDIIYLSATNGSGDPLITKYDPSTEGFIELDPLEEDISTFAYSDDIGLYASGGNTAYGNIYSINTSSGVISAFADGLGASAIKLMSDETIRFSGPKGKLGLIMPGGDVVYESGVSSSEDKYIMTDEYGDKIHIFGSGESDAISIKKLYVSGDQAILTSTARIYEAATATYDEPTKGEQLTPPTWVEVSAVNKYKATDYTINAKSVFDPSSNNYEITPGQNCTNISLYGMEYITAVNLEIREDNSSGSIIHSESINLIMAAPLEDTLVNDDFLNSKCIFDDLPVYPTPYIKLTFDSNQSEVKLGSIVIGNPRSAGVALLSSSTSRTSYDTVTTDDFGNRTVTSRPSVENSTFIVKIPSEYADYVERILEESLNKPRVYVADKPNNEKLFTLGYYERSPLTYTDYTICDTTLKVIGLT